MLICQGNVCEGAFSCLFFVPGKNRDRALQCWKCDEVLGVTGRQGEGFREDIVQICKTSSCYLLAVVDYWASSNLNKICLFYLISICTVSTL